MLTITAMAILVPCAAGTLIAALRSTLSRSAADERGIALQTVIVMVVLLAIAGGVATVLLTRGGEAIDDIEDQQIARDAADYNNDRLCKAAGFVWSTAGANKGCNAASGLSVQDQKAAANNRAECDAIPGTWTDDDPNTPADESNCA